MTVLLSVEGLSKRFSTGGGFIRAADEVSFTIDRGQTLALVGESGCGKSTIAHMVLQLLRPDSGRIIFDDQEITGKGVRDSAWRRQLSIVFQNPYSSLDPRMRVKDIVAEPLITANRLKGQALNQRVARHLEDVGIAPALMSRFPHEFSGGQRQRIAIARALALEPKLLILDEPTAALDVSIQAQVLNLLQLLQRRLGLSYLFISHNLATVENIADRVLVMYMGRLVEEGPVDQVFRAPRHPYTQALLDSVPTVGPAQRERLKALPGEVPSALNPPLGCAFASRCARATGECRNSTPPLVKYENGRSCACHHPI